MSKQSLFERLGGRPILEKVHKLFYDKAYEDPWLSEFFAGVEQKFIEAQQTDFMAQTFGGPRVYCGKPANSAHKHIFITPELFAHRHAILRESIEEANVSPELMEEWLRFDAAFERAIVKKSSDDCEQRYNDEEVMVIPEPPGNHRFRK